MVRGLHAHRTVLPWSRIHTRRVTPTSHLLQEVQLTVSYNKHPKPQNRKSTKFSQFLFSWNDCVMLFFSLLKLANVIDLRKSTMKVDERNPRTQGDTPYCNVLDKVRKDRQAKKFKNIYIM